MELPGLCSELPAEDSPTGTTWKAVVNHGGGDDDTSQSSSSVTKRKKRRRPRGGKREEGNGDDAATRGCASPVTVTSPVMVGESSEQTQQLSANASFRVVAFVSRVRTRIRRSHELLAKRLGVGLLGLSIAHKLTLVYSFSIGNGGLLCDRMMKVLSISAFLLHTGLALPYIGMRRELWVHYCVLVMDCFIRGVKLAVQREFSWAVYNVVAWGFCLYPAGGWGLHQFLNAVQQQEATTRDAVARCAVVTLVANAMPILYFALNGLLCVGFSRDPGQFCGIRVYVNDAAIFALLGTAMLAIMLTLQPISQKQMARLEDIPTQQLVSFGFYGLLLMIALTLHTQNEIFGPLSPTVSLINLAAAPCLILFLVTSAAGIMSGNRRPQGIRSSATAAASARETNTEFGSLIRPRIIMAGFTSLYILLQLCPVDEMIRSPFGPLSLTSAVFHVVITMEHAAVSWSALFHHLVHASSCLILGIPALRSQDWGRVATLSFYLLILFPGLVMVFVRFCRSVRAHGRNSTAKCVASTLSVFWTGVVPVMLYLGADTLG